MRLSPTLSRYIGRQFLIWFLGVLVVLMLVIMLFDTIELFRRAASRPNATTGIVIAMTLSRMPHLAEKAVPFAVLFGAIFGFWRMNRSHEFVVARAAGVSVWQILAPMLIAATLIGTVQVAIFNPFAAALLLNWEQLEAKYINRRSGLVDLSREGLWLRQPTGSGHYILHASDISPKNMELDDVIVFIMEGEDRFISRIDARAAQLVKGAWTLRDARITGPQTPPFSIPEYRLETAMTITNLQDSFAPPETLSFWTLPEFITVLENAGFSALGHRMRWQLQLATPLLLCAMVLLAATFSLRQVRRGGTVLLIVLGIGVAFALYAAIDVVSALGVSGRIPIVLAAWTPPVVTALLGTSILFHFEDG